MNSLKKPILFTLNETIPLAEILLSELRFEKGILEVHHFPDGEIYIRIDSDIKDREIILVDNLDHPDNKILSILFFIQTAKELGAKRIGFIAPYLAYLRQDAQFKKGEGVTSRYFASILSKNLDWLMTMDPHLHRYKHLNEIYTSETFTLSAADNIANWIKNHVHDPLIIGPDKESKQWAESIANQIKAPFLILEKRRLGDKTVEISIPNIEDFKFRAPVLVDDIISTGKTMLAASQVLMRIGMASPVCIGVHAIFAGSALQELSSLPGIKIVSCNTIKHSTNDIDVSDRFIEALKNLDKISKV